MKPKTKKITKIIKKNFRFLDAYTIKKILRNFVNLKLTGTSNPLTKMICLTN